MKNNWQTKKLGEVCKLIKGKKPSKFVSKSSKPYLTAKVVRGTEIPEFAAENCPSSVWVKKDDIVIIMDGSNSGEMFTQLEGALASTMGIVKYHENLLNPRFLLHFLITHRESFTKSRTGSAIPHLNKEEFENLEIPLPPLSEQHRIVKILDEVFEKTAKAKDNAEKNLQNAKDLFKSYSQNVFANKGSDWEEKKLGQILEIERGGSPRPIQKYLTNEANGINWIKIGDTKNVDKYIYETAQKIKPEGLKKSRLVNAGDFILSNSMSFGRPYIMKTTGAIHDGWLVLREKNINIIDKDYLYNILNSPYVFNQFDKLAAGSTVRNLNISLVSSVKIPLPTISEQKTIVAKLDALSAETKKLEKIYIQKLADLEELKKSVLKRAFDGEL